MPKEVYGRGYPFLERRELLTFDEIERLARVFARRGVRKLRLTGGEPLIGRNIARLVSRLACIPDVKDLYVPLCDTRARSPGTAAGRGNRRRFVGSNLSHLEESRGPILRAPNAAIAELPKVEMSYVVG